MDCLPRVAPVIRRLWPLVILAALAAACSPNAAPLATTPSSAATAVPSNKATEVPLASGTVKIHDGNTESEGTGTDPKVCTFHLHFFLGVRTSGTWRIAAQPGGGQVLNGTWSSGAAPDVRVPPAPDLLTLPDGQYKLYWTQDGESGEKQKVFKVDCSTASASPAETAAPVPTATATPADTASPTVAPTATPSATPAPTPPEVAQTPTPTPPAVTPVPTARPTSTPTPTPAATVHPTPTPPAVTPVPTPHPTPTPPAVTPVPTAHPTPTPPKPTSTATTPPQATATPEPSGGVGGETGGTKTPRPGGSGAVPGTDTAPAARATPVESDGGSRALVMLALGVLAAVFVLRGRGARR